MQHAVWLHSKAGSAAELVAWGVLAEEAGWDGVFVSDSLVGYPDPFTVLAGVAARTETVTLGTWVTPLARRRRTRRRVAGYRLRRRRPSISKVV